jgi:hypothetical protein
VRATSHPASRYAAADKLGGVSVRFRFSSQSLCPAIRNHRLIEFSNRKITGPDNFDLPLRRVSAGGTVQVSALRAGKTLKLKVTTFEMPS